jgi:hypothetical protein
MVLVILINLAIVGLIHGSEPNVVQCRDTIVSLDVVEGHIYVVLENGSVQIFDSLGNEEAFFDVELDVSEYEIVDDPIEGRIRQAKKAGFDHIQLLPSRQTLLIFRNTYDPESGGLWVLIKNSLRNLFKGNSTIEMYDMNSKDKLFTCELNGCGIKGAINPQKTLIAFMSHILNGTWLQVIRIRDGKVILKEELGGNSFFVFDSTTLHVYANKDTFDAYPVHSYTLYINYTFDTAGWDSLTDRHTKDLEFVIHPVLTLKPPFDTDEKYIFYNESFTGNVGVAKCLGHESLYKRCNDSIVMFVKDDIMYIEHDYFEVLSDYRLLIYQREQNTFAIADFSTGAWDEFSADDYFGSVSPMLIGFLSSNKYVACDLSKFPSQLLISKFELPVDSGR